MGTSDTKQAHICFITDNSFVMPTSVAITSLVANKNSDSLYKIYVLAKDLTAENRAILQYFSRPDVQLQIIEAPPEQQYAGVTSANLHVSATALYKFSLPDIFPNLDKLLYLDGDIIVHGDLSDFYAMDLSEVYAAVVKDYRAIVLDPNPLEFLPVKHQAYFNSGVMLLNLKRMREHDLRCRLIDYRLHGVNHYMDQDALNVVFDEQVLYLPIHYNGMYSVLGYFSAEQICTYYDMPAKASIDDICADCLILHLCTPTKPWNFVDTWHTQEWYSYYKKSPFRKKHLYRIYLYPPKTLADRFKRKWANLRLCYHTKGLRGVRDKVWRKLASLFGKEVQTDE